MTAIVLFYLDRGKTLVVASDKKISYGNQFKSASSCEGEKFHNFGNYYIFYAGDAALFKSVINGLEKKGSLTLHTIRDYILQRSPRKSPCNWIILDSKNIDKVIFIRDGNEQSMMDDIECIGQGEYFGHLPKQIIIGEFTPKWIPCKQLPWSPLFVDKLLRLYKEYSFLDDAIGHPGVYGLDLFVFSSSKKQQLKRILCKHDLTNHNSYNGWD